jgi:hypothetical protein
MAKHTQPNVDLGGTGHVCVGGGGQLWLNVVKRAGHHTKGGGGCRGCRVCGRWECGSCDGRGVTAPPPPVLMLPLLYSNAHHLLQEGLPGAGQHKPCQYMTPAMGVYPGHTVNIIHLCCCCCAISSSLPPGLLAPCTTRRTASCQGGGDAHGALATAAGVLQGGFQLLHPSTRTVSGSRVDACP